MKRLHAAFLGAAVAGFAADARTLHALEMQPGLWRFTQNTSTAKGVQRTQKVRCVSPTDARDPVAYFTPRSSGGNCALLESSASMGRLAARLQCTNGGTTTDVTSLVVIDSPTRISMTSSMAISGEGSEMTAGIKGEGERIGECP